MKRNAYLRLSLTLLLALAVFAAMAVTASAATVEAEIGSSTIDTSAANPENGAYTVNVPINITSNEGFLTVIMEIEYPDEFTLTGWAEGTVFQVTDENPEEGPARSSANSTSWRDDELELNPFTVMYYGFESNNTNIGDLITLTFGVPMDTEPGTYEISATVTDALAQGTGDDQYALPEDITADFTVNAGQVTFVDPTQITVRLVAVSDPERGYISSDGYANTPSFNEYINSYEYTTLKAVAKEDYVPAYWRRCTSDDTTEVFITTGNIANVYPLGGEVRYEPVFLENGETATLYIDSSTKEILSYTDVQTGYTDTLMNENLSTNLVTVYECKKDKGSAEGNLFTAYDIGENVIGEAKTPAYGDNLIIKKTKTNATPVWELKLDGKEFTASFDDSFSFHYMFKAGTEVEVWEKELDSPAAPAISTVTSWSDDNIARFTGLYALPGGYTLINHGIMMDQDKNSLKALKDNSTGVLKVSESTIVGRVSDNSETATPLYTVAKRLANKDDIWYGRAFLVYSDSANNIYVKYADDILASADSADISEGSTPGDEGIYSPIYKDDEIVFEN